MIKSRYSRRKEDRENTDSEDGFEHSDDSSMSDDLEELSDSSKGSKNESSSDEEESSIPIASRHEQRGRTAGRAARRGLSEAGGWGSPPKGIDKELSWGDNTEDAVNAANGNGTKSSNQVASNWKEISEKMEWDAPAASALKDNGRKTVSQDSISKAEDTWGASPNSNASKSENDSWGNRPAKSDNRYGTNRGRGSAPRPSRGNRGAARDFQSQNFDRSTLQNPRGAKRGYSQPKFSSDRDNRGRGRGFAADTPMDNQVGWKSSSTTGTPTSEANWERIAMPDIAADTEATWGNIKTETGNQEQNSGWGQPSDEPIAQEKDNGSEPGSGEQSVQNKDNGWGEAPTNEAPNNWGSLDAKETASEWIEQTTNLEISDSTSRSNDGDDNQRNTAYQRRVNARREYRKKLEEDPSFVPHLGEFWSHDDRFRDEEMKNTPDRGRGGFRGRGRGRGGADLIDHSSILPSEPAKAPQKWTHDGYESLLRLEERDEQRKRNQMERIEQKGDYGHARSSYEEAGRQRGRGRGFRGGRGRVDRFASTSRQSPTYGTSGYIPVEDESQRNTSDDIVVSSEAESKAAQKIGSEHVPAVAKTPATEEEQGSQVVSHHDVTTSGHADDDSDVEIILEAPVWQSDQVLGIPTPKSTGSEKSLNGEEQVEAGTSHDRFQPTGSHGDRVDSPSSNWRKPNSQLSPKAASWQQHEEHHEYPREHQYPAHTMLSPNAMQFVPMTTTMGGSSSNMMPMQAMYAVPMNMSGSREGMPGPVMYAPMMNSQQPMFEANGMFYYNFDANQMPMYTPVMYYPPTSMPAETERGYNSPKGNYSRKYTQQDRSRGKHSSSDHQSQEQ
jgi:hypothetical protein